MEEYLENNFEGLLKKMKTTSFKRIFGRYNSRYFILSIKNKYFGYKKSKSDSNFIKIHKLSEIVDFKFTNIEDKINNFELKVKTSSKDYLLYVEKNEDKDKWIFGFNYILKRIPEAFDSIKHSSFVLAIDYFVKPYEMQVIEEFKKKKLQKIKNKFDERNKTNSIVKIADIEIDRIIENKIQVEHENNKINNTYSMIESQPSNRNFTIIIENNPNDSNRLVYNSSLSIMNEIDKKLINDLLIKFQDVDQSNNVCVNEEFIESEEKICHKDNEIINRSYIEEENDFSNYFGYTHEELEDLKVFNADNNENKCDKDHKIKKSFIKKNLKFVKADLVIHSTIRDEARKLYKNNISEKSDTNSNKRSLIAKSKYFEDIKAFKFRKSLTINNINIENEEKLNYDSMNSMSTSNNLPNNKKSIINRNSFNLSD
jgi:hypothetical protein